MLPPRLAALHIYPLKSAGGIAVPSIRVDETGLEHDRRWMVVDEEGRFLTQRSHPRMALLRAALDEGALTIAAPGTDPLALSLEKPEGDVEPIPVWDKPRDAVSCGAHAAAWMSDYLETRCRIVRSVSPAGVPILGPRGTVRAGFADGLPALLVSSGSLEDLNRRLAVPLPMNRFRPNLVVDGVAPYAEDGWRSVRVGGVRAVSRKPCLRCVVTTTDQETGERGVEPLRTLAGYRRVPDGEVAFGVYVGFEAPGVLRVGDPVEVEPATP